MSLPKYFNCNECGLALPILKSHVEGLMFFGLPDEVFCERCHDKKELVLNDYRV